MRLSFPGAARGVSLSFSLLAPAFRIPCWARETSLAISILRSPVTHIRQITARTPFRAHAILLWCVKRPHSCLGVVKITSEQKSVLVRLIFTSLLKLLSMVKVVASLNL